MTDGERLEQIVETAVTRGDAPGVVAAVGRGDETYVAAAGMMAVGGPPMRPGTLFRIASITKPVTAAVVLSLAEDGLLGLDEPADRLLPELADRRVLRRPDGPLIDTIRAERAVTTRVRPDAAARRRSGAEARDGRRDDQGPADPGAASQGLARVQLPGRPRLGLRRVGDRVGLLLGGRVRHGLGQRAGPGPDRGRAHPAGRQRDRAAGSLRRGAGQSM